MSRKKMVLDRILDVMKDGEPRTIRRIHYLTDVSLNTVRRAVIEGFLEKVGEEPRPAGHARCGQAIVKIARQEEEACLSSLLNRAAG